MRAAVTGERASRWSIFWLVAAAVLTLAHVAVVAFDLMPWVRGPAPWPPEWIWDYLPLDLANPRSWVHVGVLLAYLVVAALVALPNALRGLTARRRHLFGVAAACIFLLVWLLVQGWAREGYLLDMLIFRTYAPPLNGYFVAPAQVNDVWYTIHHYAASMPTFHHDRPQTHPPGLFLFYAFFNELFARLAGFSAWFAPIARTWAKPDRDWILLHDNLVASAFVTSWIQVVLAALAPAAIYAFVARLDRRRGQLSEIALWSALLTPLLPSVSLFQSQWDINYLLLGFGAWFFALRGQDRLHDPASSRAGRWLDWVWAGLILSLLTWLSFGNTVFGILIGLLVIYRELIGYRLGGMAWGITGRSLARLVGALALLGAAAVASWVIVYFAWHMNYFELMRIGVQSHYNITAGLRSYAIWRWMNLVDYVLWVGAGIVLLGVVGSAWLWFHARRGYLEANLAGLAAIFWVILLVLNFSGSTRGEIGRLWIFLMPFPLFFALAYLRTGWQRAIFMLLLALGSWAMGYAIVAI